jgi:hypothetical protein
MGDPHAHAVKYPAGRQVAQQPRVAGLPSLGFQAVAVQELVAGGTPGDVAERDAAVEGLLARHAEDPLADHVARHLGGAAADRGDLPHQEGVTGPGGRPVAGRPGRRQVPGDLVPDRRDAQAPGHREHPGERVCYEDALRALPGEGRSRA